jgi:hypothetical protein
MKNINKVLIILLLHTLCGYVLSQNKPIIPGTFIYKDGSFGGLAFDSDSTYIYYGVNHFQETNLFQCDYKSKGKWKQLSNDVIELTSEDYYLKQDGYTYELKKEQKFSKDSFYIEIIIPERLKQLRRDMFIYEFQFNHQYPNEISTKSNIIRIAKNDYLDKPEYITDLFEEYKNLTDSFMKAEKMTLNDSLKRILKERTGNMTSNEITFSIHYNMTGTYKWSGRTSFEFFSERFNTESFNYLTITMPNFDLCFVEFSPMYHELIYIRNKDELFWRGETWKRNLHWRKLPDMSM